MTPNEARATLDENRRLRAFVEYVMLSIWGFALDGDDIQDEAKRLELIEERAVNPDDNEWGAERLYFMVWK